MVAQEDVRSLIRLDVNMVELGRIALPIGFAGPKDIVATADGTIFVTGGWEAAWDQVAILDGTDEGTVVNIQASGLMAVGNDVIVSEGAASGSRISSAGVVSQVDAPQSRSPMAAARPDPRGGVVVFDQATGVVRWRAEGATVGELILPTVSGTILSPMGATVEVKAKAQLGPFAIDSRGILWTLDSGPEQARFEPLQP